MNSFIRVFFLVGIFLISTSFKQGDSSERGSFYATVDGKTFQVQDDQLFRGLLMNKNASMDGKIPARTVISTTINGQSNDLSDEKISTESLQFEIGYESDRTGTPSYYAAALQYKSGKYFLVKEGSKFTITSFKWEDDRKYFRISADFDCKMRSWGAPSDNVKDVNLKGQITNLRITVPSWLASKN